MKELARIHIPAISALTFQEREYLVRTLLDVIYTLRDKGDQNISKEKDDNIEITYISGLTFPEESSLSASSEV